MRLKHWILIGTLAGTAFFGATVPAASGQTGTAIDDLRGAHVRIVIDFDRGSISFSGQLGPAPAVRHDAPNLRDCAHKALVAARAVSRGIRHAVWQLLANKGGAEDVSHTATGGEQPSC